MKRVLIYSHDTFGLGNIRRMLEVARHLVQTTPQCSVLVATGSAQVHAMRLPERVDTLKLPCLARNEAGRYGARSLPLNLDEIVRLRANLLRQAIADFAPELIVVDKKPFGVEDELAGALAHLHTLPQRPKLVLLLRDILDQPEATRAVWRKNGYCEAIEAYYDEVLVVGCKEVFDVGLEYGFTPFAAARLHYCGYIEREPARTPRTAMRQQLGLKEGEPLLLVTPGGGQDGHALVRCAVQALQGWPAASRPRAHIVCGPEMDATGHDGICQAAAALPGVSVQSYSDDMMALQGAADLVLCMGGYNTVCELLGSGRRAVVVPRVRPGQEQLVRAERMAARGWLGCLHPDALTPERLRERLQAELQALASDQRPARPARMDGLAHTSAALRRHLGLDAPANRAHAGPAHLASHTAAAGTAPVCQ